MPQYNDFNSVSAILNEMKRRLLSLETTPRLTSSSIDRGGTQSADYDGSSMLVPGTRGWKIGFDEATGTGYVHINGRIFYGDSTSNGTLSTKAWPAPTPYIAPTLASPFVNYGQGYHKAGYFKTSSGIVALTGLIKTGSSGLIFTLPPGYRPDDQMMFLVDSNGNGRVSIATNGQVTLDIGSASYTSLDGIMFPAAGVASWTPVTNFGTGWASYHEIDATWPILSYWRDPYGRIWNKGLARQTTPSTLAGDSNAFIVPYPSYWQSHYPGIGSSIFASLDTINSLSTGNPSGTTIYRGKAGTSTSWVSFQHCIPVDMTINQNWHDQEFFFNGWVRYSAGFPSSIYMVFDDGIVLRDGLLASGTVGQYIHTLGRGSLPDSEPVVDDWMHGQQIYITNSNNARGRIDTYIQSSNTPGLYAPTLSTTAGSPTWFSIAGCKYIIGG